MTPDEENLIRVLAELEKGKDVLSYSFEKCRNVNVIDGLSHEQMESFEALTSRFARLSDIVIQKAFRSLDILDLDDEGTIRDRINRAEKKGIIESADSFIDIRILRNEIAHEYKTEAIYSIFAKVLKLTPVLIKGVGSTISYAKKYN